MLGVQPAGAATWRRNVQTAVPPRRCDPTVQSSGGGGAGRVSPPRTRAPGLELGFGDLSVYRVIGNRSRIGSD